MASSPQRRNMEVKRLEIARGAMRQVRCITHRHGFVAAVIEAVPGSAIAEAWCVGFTYLYAGPDAHFVKIVTHMARDCIGLAGAPHTLSISPECVLAVGMGTEGVHTFALAAPVEQFQAARASRWHCLNNIGLCTFAKWIGAVNNIRALVTMTAEPLSKDLGVNVHGNLGAANPIANNLFRADAGTILSFDAAEPGHIAFVVKRDGGFFLNLLVLQEGGSFGQRSLNLSQPGLRGADVPPNLIPVSLAVGDEEVVVGYSPVNVQTLRPLWTAPGLVEGYSVLSGELTLRRLLPDSLPTALATAGSRMLIGASSESAGWQSGLYAMSSKGSGNYTVCRGTEWNRYWLPGSIHIDQLSFCYACTTASRDELVTEIEYASVPARAR